MWHLAQILEAANDDVAYLAPTSKPDRPMVMVSGQFRTRIKRP